MLIRSITWVGFSALLATLPAAAIADEYDVYLLAGQSNMDGRGQASDLTPEQQKPFDNAIIYYRNQLASTDGWVKLAPGFSMPPKYRAELPSPTFGPEIGFALAMLEANPNRKLALIKGSRGGTSLRKDWKPGSAVETESEGELYRDFIETIQLATTDLRQRGDSFTIRGLLWHQGESDSKSTAKVYQDRFMAFADQLRKDIGQPKLPIVVGEVYDNGKRDSVRAALQAIGKAGPRFGLVSAEDTSTWDPGTHFDAASQLLLGKRYAQVMQDLEATDAQPSPSVVCFGDSITKRGYPSELAKLLNTPVRRNSAPNEPISSSTVNGQVHSHQESIAQPKHIEVINAGVGGNTTTKAMRRLKKDVLNRKPKVVVIFFGTNDARIDNPAVHVPTDQYRANLSAMIQACRSMGSQVVLCTLPPINPEPYFKRHEREVFQAAGGLLPLLKGYQRASQRVAAETETPLVDLHALLAQQPEWMSADGVHPSPEGNAIIAKHIAETLAPILDSAP